MSTSITGVVVSALVPHAVTVEIESRSQHPRYKKTITQTKRIHAHNEIEGIQKGDMVEIRPCRPVSKTKHHEVVKKIV